MEYPMENPNGVPLKIIYWLNYILYEHRKVFRCTYLLLQFDAVHELAATLKFRGYFVYPLLYCIFSQIFIKTVYPSIPIRVCTSAAVYPYGMEWKILFVHGNFIRLQIGIYG